MDTALWILMVWLISLVCVFAFIYLESRIANSSHGNMYDLKITYQMDDCSGLYLKAREEKVLANNRIANMVKSEEESLDKVWAVGSQNESYL